MIVRPCCAKNLKLVRVRFLRSQFDLDRYGSIFPQYKRLVKNQAFYRQFVRVQYDKTCGNRHFYERCGREQNLPENAVMTQKCRKIRADVRLGEDADARYDAEDMAREAGIISYAVLCGIGHRVARVYLD